MTNVDNKIIQLTLRNPLLDDIIYTFVLVCLKKKVTVTFSTFDVTLYKHISNMCWLCNYVT